MDIDLRIRMGSSPMKEKPFDLYRSHVWHANFNESMRSPYAAIYTSLGCVYSLILHDKFLNRTDNSDDISAADSEL